MCAYVYRYIYICVLQYVRVCVCVFYRKPSRPAKLPISLEKKRQMVASVISIRQYKLQKLDIQIMILKSNHRRSLD